MKIRMSVSNETHILKVGDFVIHRKDGSAFTGKVTNITPKYVEVSLNCSGSERYPLSSLNRSLFLIKSKGQPFYNDFGWSTPAFSRLLVDKTLVLPSELLLEVEEEARNREERTVQTIKGLGNLLSLLNAWVYTPRGRYAVLGKSIKEQLTKLTLPFAVSGKTGTLYRVIGLPNKEVVSSWSTPTYTLTASSYSSWTSDVDTASRYLGLINKAKTGIIVSSNNNVVLLDLKLFTRNLRKWVAGLDKETRSLYYKKIPHLTDQWLMDIGYEQEYIVEDAQGPMKVWGIASVVPGIEDRFSKYANEESGGVVIPLSVVKRNAEELKKLLKVKP